MTPNQTFVLLYLFAFVMRVPRIVERLKAPMLRGPEWFFGAAVPADFLEGPGRAILRNYRWRLGIPWAIEIPLLAAILLLGGNKIAILTVLLVITLFTRFNYYWARQWAENRARGLAGAISEAPASAVTLSLAERSLSAYTERWVEASIILFTAGSLAWLARLYAMPVDHRILRVVSGLTAVSVYLQVGLLLLKRAIVRSRSAAPADDPEQYLAWRDGLRRIATTVCDYSRVFVALMPLLLELQMSTTPMNRAAAQTASFVVLIVVTLFAAVWEWRRRLHYLKVASRTKPAKFIVMPQIPDVGRFVCFRPSFPALLLNGPGGYALNLASGTARVAGLYAAGFAALWIALVRA